MATTIRKATAADARLRKDETWYIVEKDGTPVGRIVKIRNSRSAIYPWYVYRIPEAKHIAHFYNDADSLKTDGTEHMGGKDAAFAFARETFA